MKRKIWLTPEQVEEIWEFIDKGHEIGPLGYSLEIDLPEDPERHLTKCLQCGNYTEKPLIISAGQVCDDCILDNRFKALENRLDSIDKLDGLAGLNLRMNNAEEELRLHVEALDSIKERLDSLQSESKEDKTYKIKCIKCHKEKPISKERYGEILYAGEESICDDCREKQESESKEAIYHNQCDYCGTTFKTKEAMKDICDDCKKKQEETK